MPNLLQYVGNGTYYARTKVRGKVIRKSLHTDVWTTAKLRLPDFLNEHQRARTFAAAPKFSEAVELFKRALESNAAIKPQASKEWATRP